MSACKREAGRDQATVAQSTLCDGLPAAARGYPAQASGGCAFVGGMRVLAVARVLRLVALAGALVLVGSLFLDWFEISGPASSATFTGWAALELSDALFVVLLLSAVWLALVPRRGASWRPSPLQLGLAAAVAVTVVTLTSTPALELVALDPQSSVGLRAGAWTAFGAAALMLLAGGLHAVLPRLWVALSDRRERRNDACS